MGTRHSLKPSKVWVAGAVTDTWSQKKAPTNSVDWSAGDQIRGLRMQVILFLNPTIILILQGIKWSAPSFEDETAYCTTLDIWSFTENSSCGQLLTMESPVIHWLSITSNRFCLHNITEMSQFCKAELFRQHNSQPHIWKTTNFWGISSWKLNETINQLSK